MDLAIHALVFAIACWLITLPPGGGGPPALLTRFT